MQIGDEMLMPDASCEKFQRCFPRYVGIPGSFSAGERSTIIQHLSECSECRTAYNKLLPEQPANTDV